MIDDFLRELFPTAGDPDPFGADYYKPMMPPGQALGFAPTPPPTANPLMRGPAESVPLPRPRPDVGAMLAGREPTGAPQPGASPMPSAAAQPPAMDMLARLAGQMRAPVAPTKGEDDEPDRRSVFARMAGIDAGTDKRFLSALAGGMAGGNPSFKGGAFMKGMSGGLGGALKSDEDDRTVEVASDERDTKQKNFERAQSEAERTGAARRNVLDARAKQIQISPANRAWNKPASQRFADAQRLILAKSKEIDAKTGASNPLLGKEERDKLRAQAEAEKKAYRDHTYQRMGLNPDGSGVDATQPSSKVWGDKEATDAGLYDGKPTGTGTYDDPIIPVSQADIDSAKPGTYFMTDGGEIRRKPAAAQP